ncbi:MAG TPA: hypothetical protein VIY86_02655 [Pirellulaceae bacterium]
MSALVADPRRMMIAGIWLAVVFFVPTGKAQSQSAPNPNPPHAASRFTSPGLEYGYSYGGTSSWIIGPNGVPVAVMVPGSAVASPTSPAAAVENTSGIAWNAPVTPASTGPPTTRFDFYSPQGQSRQVPFANDSIMLREQTTVARADAVATARQSLAKPKWAAEPSLAEPESWSQVAFEKAVEGKDAVVGATNWLKLETKELMGDTLKPLDRFSLRPKCPQCGRRHLRGRHRS